MSAAEIRAQLKREGFEYVEAHVSGVLARQLATLCKQGGDRKREVIVMPWREK